MNGWSGICLYRAVTWAASPLLALHFHFRRLRGLEHALRWRERFGSASLPRPPGPLLWFHAVSLGEGMAAIPVIEQCIKMRPCLRILMTTSTVTAFSVLQDKLPNGVICQFAPVDTPPAVDAFLKHWHPDAAIFMESELWPNLLLAASKKGMVLALLNARMSFKSFKHWSTVPARTLIAAILSRFSLIAPQNTIQAVHFQLLGAPPFIINFSGNLKYVSALSTVNKSMNVNLVMEELAVQLSDREVWMASSTHKGEEEVMSWIHKQLKKTHPRVLTIIVPRHPQRGNEITQVLRKQGMCVARRSQNEKIIPEIDFYIVDTVGELKDLYKISPIAVVGGSFLPGLAGHNIAEAAAAGCAVLTGPYIGHFAQMVAEMQRLVPLSVKQVSGKWELLTVLQDLLDNVKFLEACRQAARHASLTAATGVIHRVWHLLDTFVLTKAFGKAATPCGLPGEGDGSFHSSVN
ncbi:probable 3-deoxy-D-manno-octulosonic acid transferase, mitochondrial isoform X1 [Cryptomeria japonica]|uniref:probable 3-deoxy-D-manno-octulosonic acid transferase, mitochondrial isoform X1 n=1 Tax=Cryptomeria japonica TaxID=3369 RepID=UPI0027D9F72C|nr:probable 3-deoxy-D-manno-octulosonic acid transferase, mitochondrial isoform X1 [Cryptomeria japonica]